MVQTVHSDETIKTVSKGKLNQHAQISCSNGSTRVLHESPVEINWAMEFNVDKCNVMHFGPGTASDFVMSVNAEVHSLPVAQTVRDPGVSFTSNFKSSE